MGKRKGEREIWVERESSERYLDIGEDVQVVRGSQGDDVVLRVPRRVQYFSVELELIR